MDAMVSKVPKSEETALRRISTILHAEAMFRREHPPPVLTLDTPFERWMFDICAPVAENEHWPTANGHLSWHGNHLVRDFLGQFNFQ